MTEQRYKDNVVFDTPQWLRYEMRFYDEAAEGELTKFYTCLLNEKYGYGDGIPMSDLLSSSLYELLKLYEDTNDTNKARWEEKKEWLDFVGSVKHIEFERPESRINKIIKTKKYFEDNYTKFLNKLYLATDFDYVIAWMKKAMFDNVKRVEGEDIAEVNGLRMDLGLEPISDDGVKRKLQMLYSDDYDILKKYNL